MKSYQWTAAAALGVVVGVILVATQLSAATSATQKILPFQAISLDDGVKHVGGYFRTAEGRCKLTLMIGDSFHETGDAPISAAMRVQMSVNAGDNVRLDTAGGKQAQFACASDAQAMSGVLLDQFAAK